MEDLPTELLERILCLVDNPRTLLYSVPLVCRRWYNIGRDGILWRKLDVRLNYWTCSSLPWMVDILRRGFAVRSLVVDCLDGDACALLRHSRTSVADRVAVREWPLEESGVRALLDILSRSATLLELELALEADVLATSDSRGRRPLALVAAMSELRSLRLHWSLDDLREGYGGELAGRLPLLEDLEFDIDREFRDADGAGALHAMALDLVRGAAMSLRSLCLHLPTWPAAAAARSDDWAAALAGCRRLRELRLDWGVRSAPHRDADLARLRGLLLSDLAGLALQEGGELRLLVLSVYHRRDHHAGQGQGLVFFGGPAPAEVQQVRAAREACEEAVDELRAALRHRECTVELLQYH